MDFSAMADRIFAIDAWVRQPVTMPFILLIGFVALANPIRRAFLSGTAAKLTKDYVDGARRYNTVSDAPGVGGA